MDCQTYYCPADDVQSSAPRTWNTSVPRQQVYLGIAAVAGVVVLAAEIFVPTSLYAVPEVASAPQGQIHNSRAFANLKSTMHATKSTNTPQKQTSAASYILPIPQQIWSKQAVILTPLTTTLFVAISSLAATMVYLLRRPKAEHVPLAMLATSGAKSTTKSKSQQATDYVQQMAGIIAPTGFFDPAGLSRMKTPEQLKYAREAELKHGRVAMLAALGFPFAEEFHPIFPEDTVPSDFSFQLTPLQTYWPLVVLGIGLLETFSIRTFEELDDVKGTGKTWQLKADHVSGDLGFDPLGLKPQDPEKLLEMQNKELSNGRLAMIAIAGMVVQELVVRMDVLQYDEMDIEAIEAAANTDIKALETLAGLTQSLAMFATSGAKSTTKSKSQQATDYVQQMAGIIAPTGFFDPAGLSRMKTPEQLKYAREAELKHGRVAMLAALGFPFAEEFHPIFPEDTVPSDFSFQLTPLQTYWPLVVLGIGLLETFSIRTFEELDDVKGTGKTWQLKADHVSGDLGFDPLGLKPQDPEKLLEMQNKELSNGRLAMIAIAGMVVQELVVRMDVLQYDEMDIEAIEAAANTDIKALETLAGLTQSLAMFAVSGHRH